MLHTTTKRLETCIDINTEISEVDLLRGYLFLESLDLL